MRGISFKQSGNSNYELKYIPCAQYRLKPGDGDNDSGMAKYADISIEDIIRILNEGKGQGKGNHKYRPIIPNQNGRMRPNTETYHEIF